MKNGRSPGNWRYRVIKGYKHRAQMFQFKATTLEEIRAWQQVIEWFDTILRRDRFMREITGSIGINADGDFDADFLYQYRNRVKQELEWIETKMRMNEQKIVCVSVCEKREDD